jgi:hypothetical protein
MSLKKFFLAPLYSIAAFEVQIKFNILNGTIENKVYSFLRWNVFLLQVFGNSSVGP